MTVQRLVPSILRPGVRSRGFLPALLLPALLLGATLAAPRAEASQQSLREAEARRYRAMATNDLEALHRILDDDLVYTHTNGMVDDKAAFLAKLESGAVRYRSIQVREMDPVFWAGEAGVVTGKVVLEVEAGERRFTLPVRYTAVYRLGEERAWHLLAWQSTVIPEAAPSTEPLTDEARDADEEEAGGEGQGEKGDGEEGDGEEGDGAEGDGGPADGAVDPEVGGERGR